ncbi:MAG TPA: class I SAM-dependent methyltransferase [Thermoanaerobaculia bacterium]|nr:class I SAM-dependent methyltransferase [Thermoanaerobaculia bacterium]
MTASADIRSRAPRPTLSRRLAKLVMGLRPNEIQFDVQHPETGACFQEAFDHPDFLRATPERQREIGLVWAEELYKQEKATPLDDYFKPLDLTSLCRSGVMLDLGCYIGGRSVAWLERYQGRELHGLDIDQKFIDVANAFAAKKGANAKFHVGFGESLPFESNQFDAVLTQDTFEHVRDLPRVLSEVQRVLRPGGHLIATFPSLHGPATHHLNLVTNTPFIHWMFSYPTILQAYFDILEERGERAAWYRGTRREPLPHERGYTINGTTAAQFQQMIEAKWQVVFDGFRDRRSRNGNAAVRAVINTIKRADIKALREVSEIVYVLRKPTSP